jgi:hypothetical protein
LRIPFSSPSGRFAVCLNFLFCKNNAQTDAHAQRPRYQGIIYIRLPIPGQTPKWFTPEVVGEKRKKATQFELLDLGFHRHPLPLTCFGALTRTAQVSKHPCTVCTFSCTSSRSCKRAVESLPVVVRSNHPILSRFAVKVKPSNQTHAQGTVVWCQRPHNTACVVSFPTTQWACV